MRFGVTMSSAKVISASAVIAGRDARLFIANHASFRHLLFFDISAVIFDADRGQARSTRR